MWEQCVLCCSYCCSRVSTGATCTRINKWITVMQKGVRGFDVHAVPEEKVLDSQSCSNLPRRFFGCKHARAAIAITFASEAFHLSITARFPLHDKLPKMLHSRSSSVQACRQQNINAAGSRAAPRVHAACRRSRRIVPQISAHGKAGSATETKKTGVLSVHLCTLVNIQALKLNALVIPCRIRW